MKERILNRFLIVIILAIVVSKFIHIEADPWSIKSTADIHDEAWWAENAKLKIQEDKWIKDDIAGGLAVSPVINLIYYCSFKLFGINFFSLRIFSVLASILNILLYFLLSKKYLLSYREALISTLLFASLPIYFITGRTGLLETGLISILLISILLVIQNNYWLVFFAGVSAAIGLQLKGSFLFLMPIIIYLIYVKNKNTIKKDIEHHDKYRKDLTERPKYYIITNAAYIGGFSLLYIAPIFCIAAFVHEMYELEDFMRGEDKDKDK
jgi:4-amino-4-deoxy-L-arabinose transferase-like glycosyltransferase